MEQSRTKRISRIPNFAAPFKVNFFFCFVFNLINLHRNRNPFDSDFDHDRARLLLLLLLLRFAFVVCPSFPLAPTEQTSSLGCQFAPIRNQSHKRPRPQHWHTSQARRTSRHYAFVQSDRSAGEVNNAKGLYSVLRCKALTWTMPRICMRSSFNLVACS